MPNRVCELLGIQYPVLQGGMAWVSDAYLAAAVSNGGGFGIISAGNLQPDDVRAQIVKAKKLTDKPFGVNVMLLSENVSKIIDVICEERVVAITTGAGNPGKYIDLLKKANIKVMPVVSSVALAMRLEKYGVDAVIPEGLEAGGHIGSSTTMSLVPQVDEAVSIPVIAAGGISDGRGALAAFSLGADGVQVGTRFICSNECGAHDNYKKMIINAGDRSTLVCGSYTGHPVRVLKNKLATHLKELENKKASFDEFEGVCAGSLKKAVIDGDVIMGSVMASQISGMIREVLPCAEIIQELIKFLPKESLV